MLKSAGILQRENWYPLPRPKTICDDADSDHHPRAGYTLAELQLVIRWRYWRHGAAVAIVRRNQREHLPDKPL